MKEASSLPPLTYQGNENGKMTLHLLLQIIGKIRLKMTPRKNHWWYITHYVGTQGFTTGPIHYGNGLHTCQITMDVLEHQIVVESSTGLKQTIALKSGITIATYFEEIMQLISQLGIDVALLDRPFDLNMDIPFSEIDQIHHYDEEYASTLWRVMRWIDGVFKEFSGRSYSKTCPVHLYWHSMDLAVTRFSGKKAPPMPSEARISDKDAYSHECISFGFWPGDPQVQEPAFYSYTYPSPAGIDQKKLMPKEAKWVDSNGSPMAFLSYMDLVQANDPRSTLLDFLESSYQAGAALASWDIDELTVPPLTDL
ncbi:MAG: hypothetical protein HKN87_05800 [Saprospiraceae bacterium]|nr:hypothetical protein [Saprospiraceae bacterium]